MLLHPQPNGSQPVARSPCLRTSYHRKKYYDFANITPQKGEITHRCKRYVAHSRIRTYVHKKFFNMLPTTFPDISSNLLASHVARLDVEPSLKLAPPGAIPQVQERSFMRVQAQRSSRNLIIGPALYDTISLLQAMFWYFHLFIHHWSSSTRKRGRGRLASGRDQCIRMLSIGERRHSRRVWLIAQSQRI